MPYTLHYPPQSPLALGVAALKELGGGRRDQSMAPSPWQGEGWGGVVQGLQAGIYCL